MKTKTITPTLNSSSSALRTSTSWGTASRKCWKVKCLITKMIPHVLCLISTAAERSSCQSVCEKNCVFSASHSSPTLLHTRAVQDPVLPLWLSYALMQTGRCCSRAQMSPQEIFWVLCRGAALRRLCIHLGFIWVILVSCSGQSRTIFPKERLRAWEWCDLKSETVLSSNNPSQQCRGGLYNCCRQHLLFRLCEN